MLKLSSEALTGEPSSSLLVFSEGKILSNTCATASYFGGRKSSVLESYF